MLDRRFPICSADVPACIGREALIKRMLGALTKPVPDHLQVIGPRFAGKTVLLNELIRRLDATRDAYTAVVYWDLAHLTPVDDGQFMHRFKGKLEEALKVKHSDYAGHLASVDDNPYVHIFDVVDSLVGEGRLLVVLDGCDRALSNPRLTRNLWDQLRELGMKRSLRFVTASRRSLRELIRQPDVESSPFFNMFESQPVRVGCFDEEDLTAVLGQVSEVALSPGARTELWGATNGYPILVLEVLNAALAAKKGMEISLETMRDGLDQAYPLVRDRLEDLWDECAASSQDLFRIVNDQSSVNKAEFPPADADALHDRGFVQRSGSKLQCPNRLLARLLSERPHDASALARLFGTSQAYENNIRGVFERRIAQIEGLDAKLSRYLKRGVEDLPAYPETLLSNIRAFVDRVFELIWAAEMTDRRIPSGWMDIWKRNSERRIDDWETTFPQGVHRLRLLNLMTGTERSARLAKRVSKGTYVLMNSAHAFGDFGQHQEGARVDVGTAYAALHVCIELSASFARDLQDEA